MAFHEHNPAFAVPRISLLPESHISNQKKIIMKNVFFTFSFLFMTLLLSAQTAGVQVIHNSPTPGTNAGPVVDIYVNGALLAPLTAVPFRAATPFLEVPSGVDLTVDVKVNPSTPADPSVASFPIGSLEDGVNYVVTAAGVVGDMSNPFNLYINGAGKQAAADPATVEFAVFHGSPDAPEVAVDARTVGNLIPSLDFGAYSSYLAVAPDVYYVDIRPASDSDIVATFQADLSGLAGGAATVFASGFLGNTPSFGLYAALPTGAVVELPMSPVARVQVIHNSPSPTVDIYANGDMLLPGVEFRTATDFMFIPAEVALDLAVVPAGGDPVMDDVYDGAPITLTNGETYVVVANGIAGDMMTPFTLDIQANGQEGAMSSDNIDFTILHGSPNAPMVDIEVVGVVSAQLASGLSYGEFTDYISAPAAPYFVNVTPDGIGTLTFFANLEGLDGGAATVFASGIVGGTPGFGLFAALPTGDIVELPLVDKFAQGNIIHNVPSVAANAVDIYLNGAIAVPDFGFREATGFIELPAEIPLQIGIAPAGSASVSDTIVNFRLDGGLAENENYIITAAGQVGSADFPLSLQIRAGARQMADNMDNVEFTVLHGSPGAPNVDVDARAVATLINDLGYGSYTDYISVPGATYYLDVRAANDPNIVATFEAPLTGLDGAALTVFASGLLGGNPGFGLFAATAEGDVIELTPTNIARLQIIHNSPEPTVDIYVNDVLAVPGLEFRQATEYIFIPAVDAQNIKVVPAGGDPAMDAVFDADVTFGNNGDSFLAMATGIAGNGDTPFGIELFSQGLEVAEGSGVDLLLYHGSTDAPEVDVVVDGAGTILFDDVAYGEFSDTYVNVPADAYILNVTPSDDNETVVKSYEADVSGLEGGAAVVFASGFFSGDAPAFEVWVALPDGTTFPLTETVATNDLADQVSDLALAPNPSSTTTWLELDAKANMDLSIQVFNLNGQQVASVFEGTVATGKQQIEVDVTSLNTGLYLLQIRSGEAQQTLKLNVLR